MEALFLRGNMNAQNYIYVVLESAAIPYLLQLEKTNRMMLDLVGQKSLPDYSMSVELDFSVTI